MQYQLPNGNVIYLSTEDYLAMSDQELDELSRNGFGSIPSYSQNYSSKEVKHSLQKEIPLDYTPDKEDVESNERLNLKDLPEE